MPKLPSVKDTTAQSRIAKRMVDLGVRAQDEAPEELPLLPRDPWEPRWRIDSHWIEFECGCRAERCIHPAIALRPSDPVIFRNLPEQAVYDFVCHRHGPGMNVYVRFQGFSTFDQWRRERRHLLMGVTKHG